VLENVETFGVTVRRSTSIRLKTLEETEISFSELPSLIPTLHSLELISGVEKDKYDFALQGEFIPV
jgi:hypothetical protein